MKKLEFVCTNCNTTYFRSKREVNKSVKMGCKPFCSRKCKSAYQSKISTFELNCLWCKKLFKRTTSDIGKNNFCSQSCFGKHNAANKTTGNRRSKLEIWLQEQLTILYPNLIILYNSKEHILSELDIYIPSLNLAFELNGIFHYEPIFGQDKLLSIKNNDNRKFQACIEKGIELCIIDSSKQKYFKLSTSLLYLNIITKIINQKLAD